MIQQYGTNNPNKATALAILNRPWQQLLSQSGYAADGSDFAGFVRQDVFRASLVPVNVLDFAGGAPLQLGGIDATAAIRAAMAAAPGRTLLFPPGIYLIAGEILGVSNIHIIAWGVTFRATARMRAMFAFVNQANIAMEGGAFDQGQTTLATYSVADYAAAVYPASLYNAGVMFKGCTGAQVLQDVSFVNLYTAGLLLYQNGGRVALERVYFYSPVQGQNIQGQHLHIQTCSSRITLSDCTFDNDAPGSPQYGVCGIFLSGLTGSITARDTNFYWCGRDLTGGHQLGAFSCYGDAKKIKLFNCKFFDTLERAIRLTSCWDVEVAGCYLENASIGTGDQQISIEGTNAFSPGVVGNRNIQLHDNTHYDAYSSLRTAVLVGAYDWGLPATDIICSDSHFENMKFIMETQGPMNNVRVERPTVRGLYPGAVWVHHNAGITSVVGSEASSVWKDVVVKGGDWDVATHSANTVFLDFTKAPAYTGTIDELDVVDNQFRQASLGAGDAIAARGVAGAPQGTLRIKGNKIKNYALGIDAANLGELTIENTDGKGCTEFQSNAGTNTVEIYRNNRRRNGVLRGVSRLAAGTVTVAAPEIRTGDTVILTRTITDGSTPGHLTLGTIVDKTSFVINSTSATESNFIAWEILH